MESLYILGLDGQILIEKNYSGGTKRDLVEKVFREYFWKVVKLEDQYPCLMIDDHHCLFLCSNDVIIIAVSSTDCALV